MYVCMCVYTYMYSTAQGFGVAMNEHKPEIVVWKRRVHRADEIDEQPPCG